MTSDTIERVKSVFGSIAKKYPTYRDEFIIKAPKQWLDGKRIDDNAEGLWRIHDKLYDLNEFASKHPGGSDWITLTKGTDITELFEIHHLYGKAEQYLTKFYVRDTKLPRNYNFTYKPDGFYRTLKGRVMKLLPNLDTSPKNISEMYSDIILVMLFAVAILAARFSSNYLALLIGAIMYCQLVIAHNFFHRKDNFRMYWINFSLADFTMWRITHAMSHHVYTNSYYDVEVSYLEPFLQFLPRPKTFAHKIFAVLITPLFYCLMTPIAAVFRTICYFNENQLLRWDHFIAFLLPASMFYFGQNDLLLVLKLWSIGISTCSFLVGLMALNAGHHHPDVYHEGDQLPKGLDFGIYQMNAVIDRHDFLINKHNHFITLTTFGHHTLHHLFPTLDHGLLSQLEDTLLKTCKDFEVELREYPWFPLIVGQFEQLVRDKPRSLQEQKLKNI